MSSTEITIATGTDGSWNMSDIKMFMKDIGASKYASHHVPTVFRFSQLSYSRVNPVEKIYASFPFFLFINSTYAGQLLSPLLEFQDTPFNSQLFAACDIGKYIFTARRSILERDLTPIQVRTILELMHAILSIIRKWNVWLFSDDL